MNPYLRLGFGDAISYFPVRRSARCILEDEPTQQHTVARTACLFVFPRTEVITDWFRLHFEVSLLGLGGNEPPYSNPGTRTLNLPVNSRTHLPY